MGAIEKLRDAFDSCTVMAGVENDFECVYIVKSAALLLLKDIEDENAKLRKLVNALDWCTENFDIRNKCDQCPLRQSDALEPECEVWMRELGIKEENDEQGV